MPTDASLWRLLDANANRAREGLRVIEDTARFVRHDAASARAVRALRHRLDALFRRHYRRLLAARDTQTDSGRSNKAQTYKKGVPELLAANFKRASEALRVIEEYSRLLSPRAVCEVQKIRFEIYRHEQRVLS